MTVQEVLDRVKEIEEGPGDPETLHGLEDQLYLDVLRSIANGEADPSELAKAALKAAELDFERWYA